MVVELVLLAILLVLSGFFSSSETAMTSMTKLKIRRLMAEKRPRVQYMQHWLDDPDGILTTILIGNNVVNIAATTIGAFIAVEIVTRFSVQASETGAVAGAVAIAVMTTLILVFGEVVPKTLARRYAETLSLWVCPVLYYLSRILLPLNKGLVAISRGVLRLSRAPEEENQPITHAHFRALIDLSEEEGLISSDMAPMFNGLLVLMNTYATQLMTPRTEMCWILQDASLEEALALARESGYSRIPVAKKTVDEVVGILYIKDVLNLEKQPEDPEPIVAELMRQAVFVQETRNALDILRILRNKRVHIAIVVDEYGGVSGIITLEDIIEAIVGSIHDEHDEPTPGCIRLPDGSLQVDARLRLRDISRQLHLQLPGNPNMRIGVLIQQELQRLPQQNDEVRHGPIVFHITHMNGIQVDQIKIHVREDVTKADEANVAAMP